MPAGFNRHSSGRDLDQTTTIKLGNADASVDAVLTNNRFLSGKVIGVTDAFWRLAGDNPRELAAVQQFVEPNPMRMVKLFGAPLSGASLATGALGAAQRLDPRASLGARVFLAGAPDRRASGAWVKWMHNGVEHVHYHYNAQTDQDARHDPDLIAVIQSYMDHRSTVDEVGLIFLVPEDAKVTGFSITANKRATCESPLSMGRPPRPQAPSRAGR